MHACALLRKSYWSEECTIGSSDYLFLLCYIHLFLQVYSPRAFSLIHPTLLQEAKLKTLARTYARATAGTPHSMAFDERSGNFSLVFTPAPDPSEDGANACANGAAFVTEVSNISQPFALIVM